MLAMNISPFPPWIVGWLSELRIDVALPEDDIALELKKLYRRMQRPVDPMHAMAVIDIEHPRLRFRYREADGEHYVYAEDPAGACLAGYTVFNRLIEVNKQTDPHLRAPHSKYAPPYRRQGIASLVYRWWLDGGRNLITGVRQSPASHALWHSLAADYPLYYVQLHDKRLRVLGRQVSPTMREAFHTRMLLLGKNGCLEHFVHQTGCQH